MTSAPRIDRLLETFLVVERVEPTCAFYRDILGLEPHGEPADRGCLLRLPGGQLLGLVARSAAGDANEVPGGTIPPVAGPDAPGRPSGAHLAFAVPEDELEAWRRRLEARGVDVLSEVEWERGGRSLYVRDPDGHLLELATPGLWDFY